MLHGWMKVLAVLFVLQLSGLAHRVADFVVHESCSEQCDHRSPRGDDDESECPPGCPSCHACAHAQTPYATSPFEVRPSPLVLVVPRERARDAAPAGRPLPAVFRPPRLA